MYDGWPTPLELKHFDPIEFACRCGCGRAAMNTDFLLMLDDLRERCGFPFIVTSGYRCPDHNEAVSTTGRDGPHTTGRAVDIRLSGKDVHSLIRQCALGGWMSGIGLNQKGPHGERFVHMDNLTPPEHPRPRVWTY